MFKNKEKRDTALLIFMAVATILFMAYLFIPWGGQEENGGDGDQSQTNVDRVNTVSSDQNIRKTEGNIFSDFNRRIEEELAGIYENMGTASDPFNEYQITALQEVIQTFSKANRNHSETGKLVIILDKLAKMSFRDLGEMMTFSFPKSFTSPYRFNIYLSLLLMKARQEAVTLRLNELSNVELRELLDFRPYLLLNNEIEKDFQSIAVMFYFYLFLNRLDVYPQEDEAGFFKERVEKIRDLSLAKNLIKIKELLHFSTEPQSYRIEWVEADEFDPDDKGVYQNLNLSQIKFLKQRYLVFPNPLAENNKWIEDLITADSGDIELAELRIINENPIEEAQVEKILYSPIASYFAILVESFGNGEDLLSRMVRNRIAYCAHNFTVIDFNEEAMKQESWPDQLMQFGDYLKKINL
jgi:hypothetical protein